MIVSISLLASHKQSMRVCCSTEFSSDMQVSVNRAVQYNRGAVREAYESTVMGCDKMERRRWWLYNGLSPMTEVFVVDILSGGKAVTALLRFQEEHPALTVDNTVDSS